MKRLPFNIFPYKNADRRHLKWEVRGKVNGKPARKFFSSQTDAKTFAHLRNTEALEYGREAILPTWLRVMAQRCQDLLAPYPKRTIRDATEHFIAWLDQRQRTCTLAQLFRDVADSKRQVGRNKRYIRDFVSVGQKLVAVFPDKMVADLTTSDIEEFLTRICAERSYGGLSRNYHLQIIVTALGYAKKRGYCIENVAKNCDRVTVPKNPPGILQQPDELARLLAAADPRILPAIAIGAFAGLRHCEISLMDWRHVNLDDDPCIEVPAENAKTPRRRNIPIQANLAAWLRPFARSSGPVVESCEFTYYKLLRRAAAAAGIGDFPKNALRHSFASYHVAHFKDTKALSADMGHSTSAMIFAHYRQVVRANKAAEYWQIAPLARPDTARVFAFTSSAFPWCHHVGGVVSEDGEWVNGVSNLARYFGVTNNTVRYWFTNAACPEVPADHRFHLRTWKKFVKQYAKKVQPDPATGEYGYPYFVRWSPEVNTPEKKKYFATHAAAVGFAESANRQRLRAELHLGTIENVIDFQPDRANGTDKTCAGPAKLRANGNQVHC